MVLAVNSFHLLLSQNGRREEERLHHMSEEKDQGIFSFPPSNPPPRAFVLTSASVMNGGHCAFTVRDPTVSVLAGPPISSSNIRKTYRLLTLFLRDL